MNTSDDTPTAVLRRARIFEAAMWLNVISAVCFLGYALWQGSSFFKASRIAFFQLPAVLANGDVTRLPQLFNAVIATWPERLAAFPPNPALALSIAIGFAVGVAMFYTQLRAPKGGH